MRNIARIVASTCASAVALGAGGCTVDEARIRELVREETANAVETHLQSLPRDQFGFGVAWEKEYSFTQAVKVGNLIFVSGQLAHDTEVDGEGMPKRDLMTGKNFEEQFRTTLDNLKTILSRYGSTLEDVVFLQNFVDPVAGKNKAGQYLPSFAKLIREYFPQGRHTMTLVEVDNLYGEEQLVESNAIAVVGTGSVRP